MWYNTIGFIVTLTLSLFVVPLAAEVQPAGKVPKIGLLNISSATVNARPFEVFMHALHALGYVEGQHMTMEA
jgi:hypothetical protein